MDIILKYIKNYNFEDYIDATSAEVVEENFKNFSEEFWKNPSIDLNFLKAKYNVNNSISFSQILRSYPTTEYKALIKECWCENSDINYLVEKYGLKLQKIEQLLFPIQFHDNDCICPSCLVSDNFTLQKNIKISGYKICCKECGSLVESFYSKKEVEEKKKIFEKKHADFQTLIEDIQNKLDDIKCPKCQERMYMDVNKDKQKLRINCSACYVSYDNYTDLRKDYDVWKQRAAMMIKIKAKEEELIGKFLDKKKEEDIRVKTEEIITHEESIKCIKYIVDKDFSNNTEAFIDLFKNIKMCNRLEKKLLIEICELIKQAQNDIIPWTAGKDKKVLAQTKYIKPEDPIVSVLLERSKIIIVRKTLRGLIKNNILYCCENINEIHIHPSIVDNLDSIKNLIQPQVINEEIAHLIFRKQRYTCYHCAEVGRPLKIAYLTANKNSDNLSSMIGVCDLCFNDITENEILIDGMISALEENDNETSICWKFLVHNYPDFQTNDTAYNTNEDLLNEFEEEDIIKAYAATMDKFNREGKKGNFFAYTRAILDNSDDGVNIAKKIIQAFEIDKWIEKIH